MRVRHLVRYWDWLLLLLVTGGCFWMNHRADQQFDMVTRYQAGWVPPVFFFVPLATTVYFTWKYRLFDRSKFMGSIPVLFFLVSILFLHEAIPRFVLLATVSETDSPPVLQDLDVAYVKRHYAKTTYVGSNIGIRYGGEVLQFESTRTTYFLLANERCIRAEIGQAAPGFYYIRNLRVAPGARQQATTDFWSFWLRSEFRVFGGLALFMLVAWLMSFLFRKQLNRIHLK